MISAHPVPVVPARNPRYILYAWLLVGLLLFFGVAGIIKLVQNVPEVNRSNDRHERIERIRQEHKCNADEVVVVAEFAPGLYKAYCAAKG